MKKVLFIGLVLINVTTLAQTKTTQALDDKYEGLSLYFYRNTLRMLNQSEDPAFDELIKDIDKMRFLMVDKTSSKFSENDFTKLLGAYKSESYEEIMTGRYEGKSFGVYMKEIKGDVKGTVMLLNDSTNLMVLDILGKIPLNKAPELFKAIDSNTDIGKRVENFLKNDNTKATKKKDHILD
jgi:hypothetical protein